jgi:hypothetical protein
MLLRPEQSEQDVEQPKLTECVCCGEKIGPTVANCSHCGKSQKPLLDPPGTLERCVGLAILAVIILGVIWIVWDSGESTGQTLTMGTPTGTTPGHFL